MMACHRRDEFFDAAARLHNAPQPSSLQLERPYNSRFVDELMHADVMAAALKAYDRVDNGHTLRRPVYPAKPLADDGPFDTGTQTAMASAIRQPLLNRAREQTPSSAQG